MDSKFILLSFVFIFSSLFIIGSVCAVDNGTDLDDNNLGNNDLNLEISQDYTPGSVNKGDLLDLYLNVKNTGSDTYHNLTVIYDLPEGLDLLVWPDEYHGNSAWVIDTLYPGETDTLTLICVPLHSNNTYGMTATVGSYSNSMNVHTNPLADLAVNVDYILGEGTIEWIISVINNGPDHALNTVVSNLPVDLGVKSYNLTKGIISSDQWILGDLESGESQILTLITGIAEGYEYSINVTSDTLDDVISNNVASGIVKSTNGTHIPTYSEILDSNATANPIALLLIAAIFVPILRFKKD